MIELDFDLVVENLYQGSAPPYGDVLAKLDFDTLVLCASENQEKDFYSNIEVLLFPTEDDIVEQNMLCDLPKWQQAAQIVVERINTGNKVLITCMAGLNRSGMVTAFTLRQITNWSRNKIVDHIQQCREMALCNKTFENFLRKNL